MKKVKGGIVPKLNSWNDIIVTMNTVIAVALTVYVSSILQCYVIVKSIIIIKEGEYLTSLWACVTTLYGGHDLCNDNNIQSGFTGCPITSAASTCISAPCPQRLGACEYHYKGHDSHQVLYHRPIVK